MSGLLDPRTGQQLPADAIQRVLYICKAVHVYAIPPLTSMKGYEAASWTTPDPHNDGKTKEIFTARLRILESAIPTPPTPVFRGQMRPLSLPEESEEPGEEVRTDIVLEDPETGALFAAAPYVESSVVEHAVDSSRFFAIRVVGEGKKAVLGVGFEDRSDAFDFGVALQEARKILGFGAAVTTLPAGNVDNPTAIRNVSPAPRTGGRGPGRGPGGIRPSPSPRGSRTEVPQSSMSSMNISSSSRDYSLKPGETISVKLGSRSRGEMASPGETASGEMSDKTALFSILPPPPSPRNNDSNPFAPSSRRRKQPQDREDQGEDEFGEFQ
ncbi:adaptin ear-binding coat-associated protein 1 [Arthroderma uncinatum]|uniref:adaptin ear-binding coat-associated protein 1 n=1 Tax=Arthroderma uncinatum TaxID=74035 RepID=UPI00144AA9C2|nr:adaptin ear-binding coat-associated protein 1 [Arthroderma uncinatum]KAF3483120.1 adaptin ear-binding coat-associated protein 1 [Arthroderma uncinatum]